MALLLGFIGVKQEKISSPMRAGYRSALQKFCELADEENFFGALAGGYGIAVEPLKQDLSAAEILLIRGFPIDFVAAASFASRGRLKVCRSHSPTYS